MCARDFGSAEDFREGGGGHRRWEPDGEEGIKGKSSHPQSLLPCWCSATVKILFLADNAETRPNEIAIAPANVCIIKK